MSVESSPTSKKHRVIAWKPEGADHNPAQRRGLPPWARIGGGILLALLALRIVVVLWQEFGQPEAADPTALSTGTNANLSQVFADRSRAEFARNAAMRAVEVVEKSPTDHNAIVQRRITIKNLLEGADKALGDRNFGAAVQRFDAVTAEANALANALEDRRKAREGYDKFLVGNSRLERFKHLDAASYESAAVAAGASQTFLDRGSFTLAREKIDEALGALNGLEKTVAVELEANLAIGRAALTHGDGYAAQLAFSRALELEPKNELAAKGLERAKKIEQVFALLKSAAEAETSGQLENAQGSFEKAFALDAQSATAQAGISRVKAAIKDRDFKAAIARGEQARGAKNWTEAIAGFEAALKVFPEDKDVKRQLAEARVLQREARVQDMLESAYAFEREYNWEAAKRTYLELIGYQPGQADAEEGLLRTGRVIRALLVFEKKIEEARTQAQRAQYQLAIAAFNEAMQSKPSYLELSPEQAQLKDILERQSRPVQVTFISDKKTYVTISGVRMLSKFEETKVPLLPGNYEVIGRRKGYEEVRESLHIRADDPVPPITIIANKRL